MEQIITRKSHRLKNYNYSSNGSYFITICVKNKECLLGEIVVGDGAHGVPDYTDKNDIIYLKSVNAEMVLSDSGKVVEKYIETSKSAYSGLTVDNYIIMPNHIHMIISLCNETYKCKFLPCHDMIPQYVSTFKTLITKETGFSMFQRDYHDHIIRDEKEYAKIWNYIDANPSNWVTDRFYMY